MNYHLFELEPDCWQVLISWKNKLRIITSSSYSLFKVHFYLLERRIVCIAYPNIAILLKNDPIPVCESHDIDYDTNRQLLLDDIHPKMVIYKCDQLVIPKKNLAIIFWWFLFVIIWSKNFIILIMIWIWVITWSFSRFSHSRSISFKKLFR